MVWGGDFEAVFDGVVVLEELVAVGLNFGRFY